VRGQREIPVQLQRASSMVTKAPQVKSADRVLDIIESLAASPNGLGFTELATALHIPKSSLHALLAVLTDRRFVEYDAVRRRYTLGLRTWEVGQVYIGHRDLLGIAMPAMQGVVDAVNETVQLAILDGVENVYLAKVDCTHPVRLQSEVGKRLYAHGTGLGKALLAGLPDAELEHRFATTTLPRLNARSINDLSHLLRVLETVRALGFAVDDQEYTAGLRCVAVPVLGIDGQTTAALSASIPLTRASQEQMEAALRAIARASIDISRQLGASVPDPRLARLTEWHGDVLRAQAAALDREEPDRDA